MGQRTLYLIRHGQYHATTHIPLRGPDGNLTEVGQEQVRLLGERLRALPIAVIHHSTLQRAQETASLLAPLLPNAILRPAPLLRECIPAVPTDARLPTEFHQFLANLPPLVHKRGQIQAPRAFDAFFKPTRGPDRHELLVTHGNLLSYFISRILQAPSESWIHSDIRHCALCEVHIRPSGWMQLITHNDATHLPPHLHTYS